MQGSDRNHKYGFPLIEILLTVTLLAIAIIWIWPIVSRYVEMANQAADNANARIIYNAAAMWYAETNDSDPNLEASDLAKYLGADAFPIARSTAFAGTFSVSVAKDGTIVVRTSKPAYFNVAAGRILEQGELATG